MIKKDIKNELEYIEKVKKINEGKNLKYYILNNGMSIK